MASPSDQAAEIARLQRERDRTRMERDVLKKSDRHLCEDAKVTFACIEQHASTWPMRLMCRVLDISHGGDYDWRSRPESVRSASNRRLLDDVRRIHARRHRRNGSPRVREPFPSVATGPALRASKLAGAALAVTSRSNEVIFADGIEQDFIAFGWGRRVEFAPASRVLNLVVD